MSTTKLTFSSLYRFEILISVLSSSLQNNALLNTKVRPYVFDHRIFNYGHGYLLITDNYSLIRYFQPIKKESHFVLNTLPEELLGIDFPVENKNDLYWIVKVLK